MSEHKLTVDVYANWGDRSPRYRVLVDNELLTERDFIWPGHEFFIRENIIVNLEPGTHKLEVQKVGEHGSIKTKNYTVNGIASESTFEITE